VPRTSSTSCDQAVFVDNAVDARVSSGHDAAQDRPVLVAVPAGQRSSATGEAGSDCDGSRTRARSAADGSFQMRGAVEKFTLASPTQRSAITFMPGVRTLQSTVRILPSARTAVPGRYLAGPGHRTGAARIRRMVPAPMRNPRPGVRPGCAGVPTVGSAWPVVGLARWSPPGPAGVHWYWDGVHLFLISRRCQASRAPVSRSCAVAGAGAAALSKRRLRPGRPSPASGGRPGGEGPRSHAAGPGFPRLWGCRCGEQRQPAEQSGDQQV